MAHFRGTIRAEIKSRLQGLPGQTIGPLDSIDQTIPKEHLPVPFVLIGDEEVSETTKGEGGAITSRRTLDVTVGIATTTAAELDDLSEEIERRMQPSIALGVEHELVSVSNQGPSRGESDYHSSAYRYSVTYRLDPLNADTAV